MMMVPKAFDKTIDLMEDRLSLNSFNQKVISGNISNLNTPGYVAKELSFDGALRDALDNQGLHMARNNARHMDVADIGSSVGPAELDETGPVDLDREMVNLARNSVEYQYMVAMLNKKFAMLKQAIAEGGQ